MKKSPSNQPSWKADVRATLLSFGMAAVVIAVFFIVRLLLNPVLGTKGAFAPFFIAVVITAWIGGLRAGIFTVIVSALIGDYYFSAPQGHFGFGSVDAVLNLTIFTTVGIAISAIGGAQRRRTVDLENSEARYRRLSDEVGARAEREAMINRVSAAVRSHDNPDDIQAIAVAELGRLLEVERSYFAVYNLQIGIVNVVNEWRRDGIPSIRGEHAFSNTADMFDELYKGSSTSVIVDRNEQGLSPQTIANMEKLQIRSRVSTALADSDGVMVTLTVAMANEPREWTEDEVHLVESVATLLKSGIESARVQIREHRIATELQEALQPPAPGWIPGLRIASHMKTALDEAAIGGDFYDLFPLDKQIYALVIGDVSGKGLAAAAQVATVRNMLRAYLYDYRDPAEAASKLNAVVTTNDLLLGFVTIFAGIYDAGTGKIEYVSCGHEPALVLRAATGEVEQFRTTGPPIGASEQAKIGRAEGRLDPGDTLLLYTDGLSESGPNRQDLLGTEGLATLLKRVPSDIPPNLATVWLVNQAGVSGGGTFRDDVCVLLARRSN
jgi:serine phosphatase RsbU (regulator of sigma subunit)